MPLNEVEADLLVPQISRRGHSAGAKGITDKR